MKKDYAFSIKKRKLSESKRHLVSRLRQNPLKVAAILIVIFFVFPIIIISLIAKDLPTPDNITKNATFSTTILDRNEKVVYQVYDDKNIVPIDIKDLPKHVINATIAIEDKDFFKHKGYSIFGVFRAIVKNLIFNTSEGGSTLTQQLVKNTLLTPEKKLVRKVKELILAIELERRYSKNEILEMYFNMTPYGGASWGIESAAQYYFGKSAANLTLIEAAILAGFPQSPSLYSPYIGEKGAYISRTEAVLRRMREEGYITKAQEKILILKTPDVNFKLNANSIPAPHFVFYVKDKLDTLIDNNALYKKGLVIKTTLDLPLQKEVEKIVKKEIANTKSLNISNAAVVVIDPKTGEVLAMVGSYDFNNDKFGKFNAALGFRQPGSALKPFTYATALESGYTAATVLMDIETDFTIGSDGAESYIPKNYDGKYRGPVQFRMALGSSINVPAVKILARIGLKPFMQKVYNAGLNTLAPTDENMKRLGLSITLGGGEVRLLDLVAAYSAFANGGYATKPLSIIEVKDYKNRLIYKAPKSEQTKVFSKEVSFIISHILSDNNSRLLTFAENNYLNVYGKEIAAKTGTTDDKRDNWTVGYTKDLVVGVWVGNNDNSPMSSSLASGVSGAAPIWRNIFLAAFNKNYSDGIISKPSKVKALEIDALFGGLPYADSPKRTEYFIEGTEPTETSLFYKKLKISKSTGKKASEAEISANNYEEKTFFVITEEDPLSLDGKNRWQEAINKWASEQGDDRWKVPTDTSDSSSESISLDLNEPENNRKYDTNDIRFFARAVTDLKLKAFELYINDEKVVNTTDKVIDTVKRLDNGVYKIKFVATNEKDKQVETSLTIGVNQEINPTPSLTLSE